MKGRHPPQADKPHSRHRGMDPYFTAKGRRYFANVRRHPEKFPLPMLPNCRCIILSVGYGPNPFYGMKP